MSLLETWTQSEHSADDKTFPVYRKGTGPGVIVIHEIPGLTDKVISFGEELVEAGYTVVMPSLFGTPEAPFSPVNVAKAMGSVCVRKEFTKIARRETSPMAEWLRSLARELHAELGGPGVGALGMCFTGGFALAMMVDESVAAPVLCQPSVPFTISPKHSADLNLSDADLASVKKRAAAGCAVLGVQYAKDPATGKRFETLDRELGGDFIRIDLPGRGHSVVTEHRDQKAVEEIMAFFSQRLTA